jgi:hypothetical protein
MKPFLVRTSGALAVAALALSMSFGGVSAARAEEQQIVFLQGQEMALVPVKSIEALEQRIAYLEETVKSLTEAWQHIDTHRVCASDPKSESETCLTKSQLDALIAAQPSVAQANAEAPAAEAPIAEAPIAEAPVAEAPVAEAPVAEAPAPEVPTVVAVAPPPTVEPVESMVTVESAEPPAAVVASEAQQDEPEQTGSITLLAPSAPAEAQTQVEAQPQAETEPAESPAPKE